jgi:hypothetical protein
MVVSPVIERVGVVLSGMGWVGLGGERGVVLNVMIGFGGYFE